MQVTGAVARGLRNPFPRQGVVDFGMPQKTCVFDYMVPIRDATHAYLRAEDRVGGDVTAPLAISGIHGSGKTHLLNWLADEIAKVESAQTKCLYAKADSDSFADLYRELLKNLSRLDIIDLINQAVHRLAEAKITSAKISEDLGPDVRKARSLDAFIESGYVDPNELDQALQRELARAHVKPREVSAADGRDTIFRRTDLENDPKDNGDEEIGGATSHSSGFAGTLAKMIMLVDDDEHGEAAFNWLKGESVSSAENFGVARSLFDLALTGQRSSADVTAIDALESLMALFRIAEMPVVIMIDQAEVFARSSTDKARTETIYSLVKKFVEQMKREGALVVVSGAPDAWEGIRRDIWPRLSHRAPIPIGHLSLEETRLMLEAYTGSIDGLSPAILQMLHTISGGTPREIVRIGHQAFAIVQGDWSKLTEALLKTGAVTAGTIRERELFALDVIDKVLVTYDPTDHFGRGIQKDLILDRDVVVKRLLRTATGMTLAFTMLSSTDPLTEVDAASQVGAVAQRVHQDFQGAAHFVIAIGYSSEEVQRILQPTSLVIGFDEKTFESNLRVELAKLVEPGILTTAAENQSDRLSEALASLEQKLNVLSHERRVAEQSARQQLAEHLEERAAPEIEAKELRTRWELIDILDKLEDKILNGSSGAPSAERRLMRSLLVANELNVRSHVVANGGSLYMDLIDEQLRAGTKESIREFLRLRSEVITVLRRVLRPRGIMWTFLERPLFAAVSTLVFVPVISFLVFVMSMFLSGQEYYYYDGHLVLTLQTRIAILITFVVAITASIGTYRFSIIRAKRPFEEIEERMSKVRMAERQREADF